MKNNKEMAGALEHMHLHHKYSGGKMIVLGILIILNTMYAWMDWTTFIGVMVILWGITKMIMPKGLCKK